MSESRDPVARCSQCWCTEADCSGCIARTGAPCTWTSERRDLCSACSDRSWIQGIAASLADGTDVPSLGRELRLLLEERDAARAKLDEHARVIDGIRAPGLAAFLVSQGFGDGAFLVLLSSRGDLELGLAGNPDAQDRLEPLLAVSRVVRGFVEGLLADASAPPSSASPIDLGVSPAQTAAGVAAARAALVSTAPSAPTAGARASCIHCLADIGEATDEDRIRDHVLKCTKSPAASRIAELELALRDLGASHAALSAELQALARRSLSRA